MHHLTFPSFFFTRIGADAHSELGGCTTPASSIFRKCSSSWFWNPKGVCAICVSLEMHPLYLYGVVWLLHIQGPSHVSKIQPCIKSAMILIASFNYPQDNLMTFEINLQDNLVRFDHWKCYYPFFLIHATSVSIGSTLYPLYIICAKPDHFPPGSFIHLLVSLIRCIKVRFPLPYISEPRIPLLSCIGWIM
jgi:hypothetical protein